jgi:hypothetical protein
MSCDPTGLQPRLSNVSWVSAVSSFASQTQHPAVLLIAAHEPGNGTLQPNRARHRMFRYVVYSDLSKAVGTRGGRLVFGHTA